MGLKKSSRKPKRTKTLIIDGNVLMKRSYSGAKHVFHKGKHIGGISAFYSTLRKVVVEHKIDKVVITWDGERGGTLRLDYVEAKLYRVVERSVRRYSPANIKPNRMGISKIRR